MQRESTGPALKTLRSGRQAGCLREKASLPNRGSRGRTCVVTWGPRRQVGEVSWTRFSGTGERLWLLVLGKA